MKRWCGNYQSQIPHYQQKFLLWVTRRARNPNLQVLLRISCIDVASIRLEVTASFHISCKCKWKGRGRFEIWKQVLTSFGLPQRMNGMHRTQFDHSSLELLSFVFWSPVFWPSITWNLRTALEQKRFVLPLLTPLLHNLWLLLVV